MNEVKCIYCGIGEAEGIRLSESDIIPDALTNCKGAINKNKNVCTILHNNKFGETFESKVISKLAYLRNELGIRNKNGELPEYKVEITIDGVQYIKKIRTKRDFFELKRIVPGSKDGTEYKLGRREDLEKINGVTPDDITSLDLNHCEPEKDISPPVDLFLSLDMARLVSKIGYEWFCKEKHLNDKNDAFGDVIKFITVGEGEEVVEVINDLLFYNAIHEKIAPGSHLVGYYRVDGDLVYALVCLFGLVIYKIKLGKINDMLMDKGCIYFTEFIVDGNVLRYPIGILGQEIKSISSMKLIDEKTPRLIYNIFRSFYLEVVNTQLISLKALKVPVEQIEESLKEEDNNQIFNYLIGYKDSKLLTTVHVLDGLANTKYNTDKSFNENVGEILKWNADGRVPINTEGLFVQLKEKFFAGDLIVNIKKGIEVYRQAYQRELR